MFSIDHITAALRSWLLGCPALAGCRLDLDRLAGETEETALLTGTEAEKEQYFFASRRTRSYTLARECEYGSDPAQNQENLDWFSTLSQWIGEKVSARELPETGKKGITVENVSSPGTGRLLGITGDGRAEYGMTITVEYVQALF